MPETLVRSRSAAPHKPLQHDLIPWMVQNLLYLRMPVPPLHRSLPTHLQVVRAPPILRAATQLSTDHRRNRRTLEPTRPDLHGSRPWPRRHIGPHLRALCGFKYRDVPARVREEVTGGFCVGWPDLTCSHIVPAPITILAVGAISLCVT